MNLFHLPESVERFLPEWHPPGLQVDLFHEEVLLGTAGPLKAMESVLAGGTFWILNADSLPGIDPRKMLDRHRTSGALVTLALKPYLQEAGYAPVEVDADGRIVRINGKPEGAGSGSPYTFIGAQIAEPGLLDAIPPGRPCESTGEVYLELIRAGAPLMGWVTDTFWVEIGNPAAYLQVSMNLLKTARWIDSNRFREVSAGVFLESGQDSLPVRVDGPLLLGRNASLGREIRLEAGNVAGRDVKIGDDALIGGSILWDGSQIGPGAALEDCIVAGARVPAGGSFRRQILCPDDAEGLSVTDLHSGIAPVPASRRSPGP
jgi:NDP-sugar pyrophosphorylase family protein